LGLAFDLTPEARSSSAVEGSPKACPVKSGIDLTAVLVVRSCHGPSPQDRPGGCSDFSIGVVLEMRKEGWNYLKALQYSIGIILYGF
jgi:hypothetical protein